MNWKRACLSCGAMIRPLVFYTSEAQVEYRCRHCGMRQVFQFQPHQPEHRELRIKEIVASREID